MHPDTYFVPAQNPNDVTCRYIQGEDRVLFCDGQSIGVRSDYNGVLLLDTILQKPVTNTKEVVKLELLLSEVRYASSVFLCKCFAGFILIKLHIITLLKKTVN